MAHRAERIRKRAFRAMEKEMNNANVYSWKVNNHWDGILYKIFGPYYDENDIEISLQILSENLDDNHQAYSLDKYDFTSAYDQEIRMRENINTRSSWIGIKP